jgi:hypothetical protein
MITYRMAHRFAKSLAFCSNIALFKVSSIEHDKVPVRCVHLLNTPNGARQRVCGVRKLFSD